jgi:hypothetical protein
LDLFLAVEESLRRLGQLLFGKCMSIRALSRACHHSDGLIQVTLTTEGAESHILAILKPCTKHPDILDVKEGLVLDANLLERILHVPILTVKSIPHTCRLAFSQALKEALYKVVDAPGSVAA